MRKEKRPICQGLFLAAVMLLPAISHATLVDGSRLQTQGDAVVGATFLNWQCDQPGDLTGCGTHYGDFAIGTNGVSTGSFAQYNGTFGQILDINNTNAPLNTNVSLANFIIFDQAGNSTTGNITLTLNLIPLGTDTVSTNCVGLTHCTPQNAALITAQNPLGLSAFNLDSNAGGTTAQFAVMGTVLDGHGDTATFIALFSSTFAGETPAQVLAQALSTNGTSPIESFANSVTITVVPEAATLWLTGGALLALGCARKQVFQRLSRR